VSALVRRIDERAAALTARVTAEMYTDPFWLERFGERGKRFTVEDGHFHLSHLSQALVASDVEVLAAYARWLRTLLTSRGMCSLHVAENFERLARAIADEVEDSAAAVEYLVAARVALAYTEGPARELEQARDGLVTRALVALVVSEPGWTERWPGDGRHEAQRDLRYLLCYLGDSLALARPETFSAHALWLAGFWSRRGFPPAHVTQTLSALSEILGKDATLSAALRDAVEQTLSASLRQLAATTPGEQTA
jgi:hypothetical protein